MHIPPHIQQAIDRTRVHFKMAAALAPPPTAASPKPAPTNQPMGFWQTLLRKGPGGEAFAQIPGVTNLVNRFEPKPTATPRLTGTITRPTNDIKFAPVKKVPFPTNGLSGSFVPTPAGLKFTPK